MLTLLFCIDSELKPEHFRKEQNLHNCINDINTILSSALPDSQTFLSRLWNTLETEIRVTECDLYSYVPDPDADPFDEEGNVYVHRSSPVRSKHELTSFPPCCSWCFNYFFFNKKLRRVIFFTCRAVNKMSVIPGRETTGDYGWSVEDQIAEEMDM